MKAMVDGEVGGKGHNDTTINYSFDFKTPKDCQSGTCQVAERKGSAESE